MTESVIEATEVQETAEWMLRSGVAPEAVMRHLSARYDLSTIEALAVIAAVRVAVHTG